MFAVLDLGTNTFHLVIAKKANDSFEIICKKEIAVKLGEGSINQQYISDSAYTRGLDALKVFKQAIDNYQVEDIKAIATSAIRDADNGKDFISAARKLYGFIIETIDGETEAEYIYKAVVSTVPYIDSNILVMDIGGGSVELIIGNKNNIYWKQSFAIGAARLIGPYHQQDPIDADDLCKLIAYIHHQLEPLEPQLSIYKPQILVGAAGAFQSILEIAEIKLDSQNAAVFDLEKFYQLYHQMINSSKQEREQMKGLDGFRVEMMVAAMVLMKVVLDIQNTQQLYISTFSLKEGLLLTYF